MSLSLTSKHEIKLFKYHHYRLGWFHGDESRIPYDYNDVIAVSRVPTLVLAPKGDRTADHPALMELLDTAATKLGPSAAHLLTVVETEYVPPQPRPSGNGAIPAQGINRLSDEHQDVLEAWLNNVTKFARR